MRQLACVDLPGFPLQLLCCRHPEWRGMPVVVISEDKPQGIILWACEKARRARILPGQRYAHALSLSTEVRAGVVSSAEIAEGVATLTEQLRAFSPHIEPCRDEPGVFWLDASGLERLYRSLHHWARAIDREMRQQGWMASLVVGFSRFGTYAIARSRGCGVTVFGDEPSERITARDVPLELLDVSPKLRDALRRLGITTVGEFVHLPAGGILTRFGRAAHQLHALAAGEKWDPLRPVPPPDPAVERIFFDDPESDSNRLLFAIKRALDPLLAKLAGQYRALTALIIEFELDRRVARARGKGQTRGSASKAAKRARRRDIIKPAEPTLDARTLLRLVHLRLESHPPDAGVNEIVLAVEDVPATREQLALFAQRPRRDLDAANEALARLRAEFGNGAVVKAVLRDGHLPEARYSWEPVDRVSLPNPSSPGENDRPLVRRIRARPAMLPPQEHRFRDDGWLLGDLERGPVIRVVGPYIVSGGWWVSEVHREYHFVETRRGDCLWIYYDRKRRRWFLQGQVE
ncbi:MAG: DNA polymerase Y family protein [Proteobacteria bacterium]|nr:DNA polymerase Y family protein [Pseudomonadota bacterium]